MPRSRGWSVTILTRRGLSVMRARSDATVPSAARRPSTMAMTRSAIRSTSASTWEETITVRPWSPSRPE